MTFLLKILEIASMTDFINELAIGVPITMVVWGLLWYIARLFGVVRTGAAFSARDLRTWPLSLVLTIAALLGLIFAGIEVLLGERSWSRIVASGVAAFVIVGLVPRLWGASTHKQ